MGSVYTIGPRQSAASAIRHTMRRVTSKELCPICNHADWCELRDDGAVHCMRVESDVPSNRGAGWWHRFPTGNAHTAAPIAPQPKPAAAVMASELTRDVVYQALIDACQLSAPHEAWLLGQGLTQPTPASYATLNGNRAQVAAHLQRTFTSDVLATVPGIFLHDDGSIGIASSEGLLLAVRDTAGRIVRMQCRSGQGKDRAYRWLSSSSHGGPSSGAIAHYAAARDTRWLWITEGVKKAEVTAHKLSQHAMGLPGHAAIAAGEAMLEQLVADGLPGVIIALDEDASPDTVALVDKSRNLWVAACLKRGLAVRVARWDGTLGKGIDDLLLAGHKPTITAITADSGMVGGEDAIKAAMCDDLVTILSSGLPATERIAVAAVRIAKWDKPGDLAPIAITAIAPFAAATTKSQIQALGRSLKDVASRVCGITRTESRDSLKRTRLSFALDTKALPAVTAIVAPSPRVVERARKQRERVACRHCGQPGLFTTCPHCGVSEAIELSLGLTAINPLYRSAAPQTQEPDAISIPLQQEGSVGSSLPVVRDGFSLPSGAQTLIVGDAGDNCTPGHRVYVIGPAQKKATDAAPCPGCGKRFTAKPAPGGGMWCGHCGATLADC